MSESLVGVSVAVTRQKAVRFAYAPTPRLPLPGGTNFPASTTDAELIFAFASFSVPSGSHGVAARAWPSKTTPNRIAPKIGCSFMEPPHQGLMPLNISQITSGRRLEDDPQGFSLQMN